MFCWQAWGGSFTPKSPFEVPKKLQLFMLKGPRKKHYQVVHSQHTCLRWANVGIGAATSPSGDDVGPTLFRRRLATSQYDAKPTSGDDVALTLFPRRLVTLSQRRVTMLAQRCSDDGWRRHSTTLSQHRVTMLAQRCSADGWRR